MIMEQARAEQLITEYIKELAGGFAGEIQPDTGLSEIIDSTAIMELVLWVEPTFGFGVEVDDITPENFGTVHQLGLWVMRNTNTQAEAA